MAASPSRSLWVPALLAAVMTALVAGGSAWHDPDANEDLDRSDPAVAFALALTEERTAWLQDFIDQGRDPRSLPVEVLEVDDFAREEISVEIARKRARFVVHGHVVSTTYVANLGTLGSPRSIATVEVDEVAKGQLKVRRIIEVVQGGGPQSSPTGDSLVQFPGDPLLLPGDEVILLLIPALDKELWEAGRVQTVYRAGVYLVTPQGVYANGRNDLAGVVSGRSPDEVLALFK